LSLERGAMRTRIAVKRFIGPNSPSIARLTRQYGNDCQKKRAFDRMLGDAATRPSQDGDRLQLTGFNALRTRPD
jgi:hypothetical protein